MTQVKITSTSGRAGFTLIEMVMAILVMMVGLLGLLQALNVSIDHDMRNKLREEAILLAEERMHHMRSEAFTSETTPRHRGPTTFPSNFRGYTTRFTVYQDWHPTRSDGVDSSRELSVVVVWRYKNFSSSHVLRSVKAR